MARPTKPAWGANKYGMQIGAVVRRLVREADFFNEIAEWMRDDLRNMPVPLLIRLLEYGYGKPPERIEVSGEFSADGQNPIDFSSMSESDAIEKQRELVMSMLQRLDQKRELINAIDTASEMKIVLGETVQ